jgi:gp16 family phage-associated protein
MKTAKLKTAAQARAWFSEQGLSIAEWCREHGYGVSLTREILAGNKRCLRGQSHQIAVRLGMKHGVITRSVAAAQQKGPHTLRQAAAQRTPGSAS